MKLFLRVAIPAIVMGVGFFDLDNYRRGVAPNAIELHTVNNIDFKSGGQKQGVPK